jgi:hypothetical protein
MQRTKSGWGWSDLDALYRGFGFDREEGANHTLYVHPEYVELRATVARHNSLAPGYAQHAVKVIRRLKELEAAEEPDDATD